MTKPVSPFYSRYWQEGGIPDYRDRWDWIFHYVRPNSEVLDVGCGDGRVGESLIGEKNCTVTGIDVCEEVLEEAGARGLTPHHVNAMTQGWKLPANRFDYVLLSCILEHVVDPELILYRSLRVLKPEGEIVAIVPNVAYVTHRMQLLTGRFPRQWVHHPKEHFLYWNHAGEFEEHVVSQIPELSVKAKYSCQRNSRGRHPVLAKSLDALAAAWPNLFGYYSIYILGKSHQVAK